MPEAQLRIISGIEKIHSEGKFNNIAIISHADMIKSAVAYYAGIHLDFIHRIEISPASISVIEIFREVSIVRQVNCTGEI